MSPMPGRTTAATDTDQYQSGKVCGLEVRQLQAAINITKIASPNSYFQGFIE
jgi:hypothetical protein